MKIINGEIFSLEQGFEPKDLFTDGDKISDSSGDDEIINAEGCYVIPGLVDVHFHGCVGEDFSDASPEGLQKMADWELSQGVMYICPAGMTLPEETLSSVCKVAAAHRETSRSGAQLAGIHLEGPFLSTAKKGAQNEAFLHDPDYDMLMRLQAAAKGAVKLVTVAPEQPGAMEFIRKATASGIHVSVGHTVADYDIAMQAFANGADHATHLFNGMPSLHHRAPAVIGAAFDNKQVKPEIICDGIHIHASVIRLAFRIYGADRMILISDSLRATGMPDGEYPFGGQMIEVHGHRATILGHPETLAGSVTSLMGCLKTAISFGIPVYDAVRAASYNPACSIGIEDHCGTLEAGKDASFLLLDKETMEIRNMVFMGKTCK